jgi:hypothetical protein
LKVKGKAEEFNTEDAEDAEKKRKRKRKEPEKTGLKTGHFKEEPYD